MFVRIIIRKNIRKYSIWIRHMLFLDSRGQIYNRCSNILTKNATISDFNCIVTGNEKLRHQQLKRVVIINREFSVNTEIMALSKERFLLVYYVTCQLNHRVNKTLGPKCPSVLKRKVNIFQWHNAGSHATKQPQEHTF